MSGRIKSGFQRQAFKRSTSNSDYCTINSVSDNASMEHSRQSPINGSMDNSACCLTHDQCLQHLKEDIMQSIQRDVLKPMLEKVGEILSELQEIKTDNAIKRYHFVSCHPTVGEMPNENEYPESDRNDYSATEPKRLLHENTYQEEPEMLTARKEKTLNLENKTNRRIDGNIETFFTSDRHRNDYDNVSLIFRNPPGIKSNSLHTRGKLSSSATVAVKPRPRSAIHFNRALFDERECLAHALQFHIEDLIDGVVFHDSELPDCLLQEGCVTEDECATVRRLRDRKDQIRILVSLIKGRDLRVLKGFLKHIEQHNPDVAEKISEKFEANKRDGLSGKLCALCMLMKQFNVKHVADSLWAIQVINDELYYRIIYSEAPVGAQSDLWNDVVSCLKMLDRENAEVAHKKLIIALSSKNLFTHLADGIKGMLLRNHEFLTCACEPKPGLWRRSFLLATTSSESVLPDSSSDSASNDQTSCDGTENGDMQERRQLDTVYGMPIIAEVTEDQLFPTKTPDAVPQKGESHQRNNNSLVYPKTCTLIPSPRMNNKSVETSNKTQNTNQLRGESTPHMSKVKPENVSRSEMIHSPVKPLLNEGKPDKEKVSSGLLSRQKLDDLAETKLRVNKESSISPLPEKKKTSCDKDSKSCSEL